MKVKATRVSCFDECKNPGDFYITEPSPVEDGNRRLSFLCPCGCGDLCGIRIRDDGQQTTGAWAWNRNVDCPTVTPSIRIMSSEITEHWHGHLTNGEFVQ